MTNPNFQVGPAPMADEGDRPREEWTYYISEILEDGRLLVRYQHHKSTDVAWIAQADGSDIQRAAVMPNVEPEWVEFSLLPSGGNWPELTSGHTFSPALCKMRHDPATGRIQIIDNGKIEIVGE